MHPDQVILRLAARQHGVITRHQLLGAGLTDNQVNHRIRLGVLDRVHRGVFRVGPIRAPLEREMAAVLACGPHAVLSHRSAAVVWRMLAPDAQAPIDVSTRCGTRAHVGVRLHRLRPLAEGECTRRENLPITGAARTLLDVAAVAPVPTTQEALSEALVQRVTTEPRLRALLALHPRARGAALLGRLLQGGPTWTRSEAETRFLSLVHEAHLPEPEVNVRIAGLEVDFLWRRQRLVVEVDGFRFHRTSAAFERDRSRDGELLRAGIRVLRVTWRQLATEQTALAALLAQALGAQT